MATVYQYACLVMAGITLVIASWFLYYHVIPTKGTRVWTRQRGYRGLTLVTLMVADALTCVEMAMIRMMTLQEYKERFAYYSESLLHFFIRLNLHVGYIFYTMIILHRYNRLVGDNNRLVGHFNQKHSCSMSWSVHLATWFLNLAITLVALLKCILILFYQSHPRHSKEPIPLYDVFHIIESGLAVITPLLVMTVEAYVNYKLISTALKYQTQFSHLHRGRDDVNRKIKNRMLIYLSLFVGSDIGILVIYALGVVDVIPLYETAVVADSWLILHVIFAFKLLDLLVQELKRLPEAIADANKVLTAQRTTASTPSPSVGLDYASRTDIVTDGLLMTHESVFISDVSVTRNK